MAMDEVIRGIKGIEKEGCHGNGGSYQRNQRYRVGGRTTARRAAAVTHCATIERAVVVLGRKRRRCNNPKTKQGRGR